MRVEYLQYLVDFAEMGTVSAVADKNFMSEQGMSRVFRQMEKELDIVLFQRSGKNVRLTEAGHAIIEQSKGVVRNYQALKDALDFYNGLDQGSQEGLSIMATPLAMMCLAPLLDIQQPGLFPFPVILKETDLSQFSQANGQMASGEVIGLATVPSIGYEKSALKHLAESGLTFVDLLESEVGLLVSAASPLSQMEAIRPERYSSRGRGNIGVACPNDGALLMQLTSIDPSNIRLITNNIQYIYTQIRRGQVVMFLPKLVMATSTVAPGITFVPMTLETQGAKAVRFGLVLADNYDRDERSTRVVNWLKARIDDRYAALKLESVVRKLY